MKIAIIGTGTWGTALGQVLTDNGHDVILYGREESQVKQINEEHRNVEYFGPDLLLPNSIVATNSLEEALNGRRYIVLAVPTAAMRSVLAKIAPILKNKTYFINAAKGFDPETSVRISELIRNEIPEEKRFEIISIIGPSHAEEVILRQLTAVTSTCLNLALAHRIAKLFSNNYFRVYAQTDEVGAEIGAAMKNTIAIASGILQGLGYGDNARAALVTRGLAEMVKYGKHFGGHTKTYLGLTGLGDLMVTCNSYHSRNFMAGLQIGRDDSSAHFLATNKATVEGIRTAKVIFDIAKKYQIELPIVESVYHVLYDDAKPSELIRQLMTRPLKEE